MPALAHRLFFIRHGETDWNREGRLQGQRDIPLNDIGRIQAAEAGLILKGLAPAPDALDWWVSPMGRTRETAERAREAIGLEPGRYRTDDRLKELTFGRWEGLTWREVRKTDPAGAERRERDKWGCVPPEGESYAMLTERLAGFLPEIARDSVIVAHGGVARALMTMLAGMSPGHVVGADVWQGKVLVFERGVCVWRGPSSHIDE